MSGIANPSLPPPDTSERVILSVVPPSDPTHLTQQVSLHRRLVVALRDLGLTPDTLQGLVGFNGDHRGVDDLSVASSGRLVRQIEDLGTVPDRPWLRSGPSDPGDPQQLSLF